jgi:chitinase
VAITSPANGASYTAPAAITIAAAPASDAGISQVQFFANGAPVGSATAAPYSINWSNVAAGSYTVTATAIDNAGASVASAPVTITVTTATDIPPTVSILSPTNGSKFSVGTTIALTAAATDPDGTVARVSYYSGSTLVGSATTAPYTVGWKPGTGTYTLTAVAVDNLGAQTTSAPVSVSVGPRKKAATAP